jgi:transcriptional regulator with XRE-family HTH domain
MSRAARLDEAMERAGVVSMQRLASLCCVSKSSLYRFSQGSDVRLSVLERLAHALKVSPAWLAWGLDVKRLGEGALVVRGDVLDPATIAWVEDVRRTVPGAVVVFQSTVLRHGHVGSQT